MPRDREQIDPKNAGGADLIDGEREEETPYDQGEISPWYGADNGHGNEGSSRQDARSAAS